MMPTAAADIAEAVEDTVERLLGVRCLSAFVYGSVVTGAATAASDIDTFMIVDGPLTHDERRGVRDAFAALQWTLGFTPDPQYPVEVFTAAACRAALSRHRLGGLDDDDAEIVHALTSRRLVVRGQELVSELGAFVAEASANR